MAKFTRYKKDVLKTSRWLSEHGYFGSTRGTGGNVSLRINNSTMAITPSSLSYQKMTARDIFILKFDLSVIEGKASLKPSMEAAMHSIIYRNRPDVNAVVHTHQLYGSLLSVINTPIPALFDEVSLALGEAVEIIPYAFSGSQELANNVAEKLPNKANAYIIQNHGILALGDSLDQALLNAELLEKVAHVYYLSLSTGKSIHTITASAIEQIKNLRHK